MLYLNNPIQFILKQPVSLFDLLQLIAVGDQRGGIDLSGFDEDEAFMEMYLLFI